MGNIFRKKNLGDTNTFRNTFLGLSLLSSMAITGCKTENIVEKKCVPINYHARCSEEILVSGIIGIQESLESKSPSISVKFENLYFHRWKGYPIAKLRLYDSCGEGMTSGIDLREGESLFFILGNDPTGNPKVKSVHRKNINPNISIGAEDRIIQVNIDQLFIRGHDNTQIRLTVKAPCK